MGKGNSAEVDILSGQIPTKVLLTDPLTGGVLGILPTQGSLLPRLRSQSWVVGEVIGAL